MMMVNYKNAWNTETYGQPHSLVRHQREQAKIETSENERTLSMLKIMPEITRSPQKKGLKSLKNYIKHTFSPASH